MEANFYRYITECHPDIRLCEFEPKLFTDKDGLPKGVNYLPDFRLTTHAGDHIYVEVCYKLDKYHETKVDTFRRSTGLRLEVVDSKVYKEIERRFAKKIRGWER